MSDSCTSCGSTVSATAQFCGGCGQPRSTSGREVGGGPGSHGSVAVMPAARRVQAAPPVAIVSGWTCDQCGSAVPADVVACTNCQHVRDLPPSVTLATPGRRLVQHLLDLALIVLTLGIGFLIWSLIVWGEGQTPAMRILHLNVLRRDTKEPATMGTMALRELIGKLVLMSLIASVTFGIGDTILYFMLLWDKNRQELWDKVATTIVVDGYPAPDPVTG